MRSSTYAGNNGNDNPNDSKADFIPGDFRSHWQEARQLTGKTQHLFGSILLDEKMRKSILKMNIEFWCKKYPSTQNVGYFIEAWKRQKQNRPANIRFVGLKCIGPMPLEGKRVATKENHCPFQTILDLDNSYLYMSTLTENDPHTIKLSKRCVSCWTRRRPTVALATRQLFASAEDQRSTCTKTGCFQTRWFGTRYCYRHADDELGTNWHSMPRYDPAQISSEF